jgi:hypothetical protein
MSLWTESDILVCGLWGNAPLGTIFHRYRANPLVEAEICLLQYTGVACARVGRGTYSGGPFHESKS